MIIGTSSSISLSTARLYFFPLVVRIFSRALRLIHLFLSKDISTVALSASPKFKEIDSG